MPLGNNPHYRELQYAISIDTTGLKKGAAESKSVIAGLSKYVTKANVFAAIGISASLAFKQAYSSVKEFHKNLKEVETISLAVQQNYDGIADSLHEISTRVPETARSLTKAYYQVVSAGYDGAKGLQLLEQASKGAVAGVTDTLTAVDGLTTVLNSYNMSTDKAEKVTDIFFKTVQLGKTTFPELARNMSIVVPLAASMGVSFEEVSGAIATLTKQGVPTNIAVTQIRSAMVGMTEALGDGWAKTMSLQEGFQKLRDMAGGSELKLQKLVGRIEAVGAVLGTTDKNLAMATSDLNAMQDAAGASTEAFKIMVKEQGNQAQILSNTIHAKLLRPVGEGILEMVNRISGGINNALQQVEIANQSFQEQMRELRKTGTPEQLQELARYPGLTGDTFGSGLPTRKEYGATIGKIRKRQYQEGLAAEEENRKIRLAEEKRLLEEIVQTEKTRLGMQWEQQKLIDEYNKDLGEILKKATTLLSIYKKEDERLKLLYLIGEEEDKISVSKQVQSEILDSALEKETDKLEILKTGFIELGGLLGSLDKDIGGVFSILGDVTNIVSNRADMGPLGMITGGVGVLKGLIGLFKGTQKQVLSLTESLSLMLGAQQSITSYSTGAGKLSSLKSELTLKNQLIPVGSDLETRKRQQEAIASLRSTRREINELLTGSTAESIADGIADGFRQGISSAELFASTFENLMATSLMSMFKRSLLSGKLESWFAGLTSELGGLGSPTGGPATINKDLIERYRTSFMGLQESAQSQWNTIQQIMESAGISFDDVVSPGSTARGLSGTITGMTEQTASKLEGQFTAMRISIVDLVSISNDTLQSTLQIANNTSYNRHLLEISHNIARLVSGSGADEFRGRGFTGSSLAS